MKNMYFFRRTMALVLLATSLCSTTEPSCDESVPVVLDVPCYAFKGIFRALYVKPGSSNLHYVAQATPLPIQSPSWNIYDIHPDYHYGFDIAGQLFFHERNANLAFNWEHFKSRTCTSHTIPVDTDMVGPFFEIGPDASAYASALGRVKFNINTANVTYGPIINCGEYLSVNPYAGVNFSKIKQCLTAVYSNTAKTIVRTITTPTKFSGAGPEVGFDFTYTIMCGLRATGHLHSAIIIGNETNSTSYTSTSPALGLAGLPSPNNQKTCTEKRNLVVPLFSQRLGIDYLIECGRCALSVELGYEASIFMNALQSIDMGSEVVTPPIAPATIGVFARTFQRNISNLSLHGGYFALSLAF